MTIKWRELGGSLHFMSHPLKHQRKEVVLGTLRSRKWAVVFMAALIFTPLASWVIRIIGMLFSIVGFFLSLVNPLGLFVAICIVAFLVVRALEL